MSLHYDSFFQNVRIKWIGCLSWAPYFLEESACFTFLMLMDSLFYSPLPHFFSPGQVQILGARVAERDWPAQVTREAWPWNLPKRLATVQCAMTMPQATIMGSGPVRAVRPSSREVFKVIVCWKWLAPFLILRGEATEEGSHVISQHFHW